MNYIDLIILFAVVYYLFQGYKQGFVHLSLELASLFLALFLGLLLYGFAAKFYSQFFNIAPLWASPLGFFTVVFLVETGFFALSHYYLIPKIAKNFVGTLKDKHFSIIPAVLKAVVLSSIVLSLIVSLPLKGTIKKDISASRIGSYLVKLTYSVDNYFEGIFGGALKQTLTFLTIREPDSGETYELGFTQNELTVDSASEIKMLDLINAERTKNGLKILTLDPKIVPVARSHSKDMFEKGYFAHKGKDGRTPCQRMTDGGVVWSYCGENLAYAQDVDIAHQGLMNSPGHRANILSEDFGRVGIGVIDGGEYGKMFTQNFAN